MVDQYIGLFLVGQMAGQMVFIRQLEVAPIPTMINNKKRYDIVVSNALCSLNRGWFGVTGPSITIMLMSFTMVTSQNRHDNAMCMRKTDLIPLVNR